MRDRGRSFKWLEILVTVLIVIAVAGFAVQWSAGSREAARVTTMVDDLRRLAMSQEGYYADHSTYYGGVLPSPALAFTPSGGVTMTIDAADSSGWSATAAGAGTARHCSALYGKSGPADSVSVERQAVCTP